MDLGREFTLVQSNGFRVRFKVRRDEEGRQRFVDADAISGDGSTETDGSIMESKIKGDRFVVTVEWDGGGAGKYSGRRDIDGTLSGETFDLNNPDSHATWFVPDKTFPA